MEATPVHHQTPSVQWDNGRPRSSWNGTRIQKPWGPHRKRWDTHRRNACYLRDSFVIICIVFVTFVIVIWCWYIQMLNVNAFVVGIGYHVDVHVFVILRMFKGLVFYFCRILDWSSWFVCGAATVLCQPATLKKTWKCYPIISYTHCLMIKFYCVRVFTYFLGDYVYSCMFSVCVCVATRHVEFLAIFMFRFVSIRLHNSVFICGFFEAVHFTVIWCYMNISCLS